MPDASAGDSTLTAKKTGVRKTPNAVTPSIPPRTAAPAPLRRISAPAPFAKRQRYHAQRMNATDIIAIGRKRELCALQNRRCAFFAFLVARPSRTPQSESLLDAQTDQHHEANLREDVHVLLADASREDLFVDPGNRVVVEPLRDQRLPPSFRNPGVRRIGVPRNDRLAAWNWGP